MNWIKKQWEKFLEKSLVKKIIFIFLTTIVTLISGLLLFIISLWVYYSIPYKSDTSEIRNFMSLWVKNLVIFYENNKSASLALDEEEYKMILKKSGCKIDDLNYKKSKRVWKGKINENKIHIHFSCESGIRGNYYIDLKNNFYGGFDFRKNHSLCLLRPIEKFDTVDDAKYIGCQVSTKRFFKSY